MRVEAFVYPAPWSQLVAAARRAEAAGFDAVTIPEIVNEPLMDLALASQVTQRVSLRTGILVAFPRSPMVVASTAMELHRNSGGRVVLGLGTQVKGHIERRFGMPWPDAPARQLSDYVKALRAIWLCWQRRQPLRFDSEYYRLSVMTPEFSHPPTSFGPIPVYTAAVRAAMLRLAGRVGDGVRLHGFCTRRYLEEVVVPQLDRGLEQGGRPRDRFEVCGGGFICTGPTDEVVARQVEHVRYRTAFYGSTRTYAPVMELHGWGDLAAELHRMSKAGKWEQMAAQIPDDVVHTFAAVARWDGLAKAVEERFGGISDAVELQFAHDTAVEPLRDVLTDVSRIPTRFERHPTWDEL